MEHPRSPLGPSDRVPLSSSPAASAGSECETIAPNIAAILSCSSSSSRSPASPCIFHDAREALSDAKGGMATDSPMSRICEGERLESTEKMHQGIVWTKPVPESSTMQSPSRESASEGEGKLKHISNLPLLSPFTGTKNEPFEKSESIESRSAILQRALDSFPSALPIAYDPTNSTPSAVSVVLQSPFGVNHGPVSSPSLASDLFISSSDHASSSDAVDNSELCKAIQVGYRVCQEANTSSDSEESTTGAPSTPKALTSTLEVPSSSPYLIAGNIEARTGGEVVVCAGYVHEADSHATATKLDLSHSSPKLIVTSSELVSSTSASEIRSMSPDVRPVRPAINNVSSSNELSRPTSPEPINHKSPLKRPREANDAGSASTPKRMTLASQRKEHKKLASPFRSPLLSRPNLVNISTPISRTPRTSQPSPLSSMPQRVSHEDKPSTPLKISTVATSTTMPRSRTPMFTSTKVKSQFKSPLVTSSSPSDKTSRISTSRTIQELERKVQLLKRAVKIRKAGDEEKLEELVKKWRLVGREAAWDLWQIVRDNAESSDAPYPGTNAKSSGGMSSGSWGWAEASEPRHAGSWGWDKPPEKETPDSDCHSEELESPTKVQRELFDTLRRKPVVPRTSMLPPTPRGAYFEQNVDNPEHDSQYEESGPDDGKESQEADATQEKSLGTMLRQLGIPHEILGWVEDEGDFVDN